MSETVIRADDADIVVKPGVFLARTKIKIVERNTEPTKHVAITYLDESDRLALAQAIAGDAYRVVAVDQLWDFCDATWVDLQTGTAADGEGDVVHADEPRSTR